MREIQTKAKRVVGFWLVRGRLLTDSSGADQDAPRRKEPEMSRKLSTSIAVSALLAVLAAPVLAQEAQPTQPPAAEAQAPVTLPKVLQDAGLTDVKSKRGPRGSSRVEGKLADGTQIDAMLDDKGELRGLRARGEAVLPETLTTQLVPQSVRDNAVFGELGKLKAVFSGERGVALAGQDDEGNKIRAAFAQDGTLLRFGRGEAERDKGWHGKRHHHHWKGGHDRHRGDWGPGPRHGRGGPEGDMPPPPPPAGDAPERQGALSPEQINHDGLRRELASAGYSRIGEIMQDGPRLAARAVNPEGEPVTVELSPKGEVMREINQ